MAVAAATRIVLPCFAVLAAAAAVAALPSSPSTRAASSSSSREEGDDPFGGDPRAFFDSLFDDDGDGGDGGGGGGGGPCHEEAAALRDCMRASGDDLDCAACVTSGLDTTVPITCGMLGGSGDDGEGEGDAGSASDGGAGEYCRGVVACVDLKCKEDCRGEYLAGLDCTLGRECAGVACSPRVGGKVRTGASGPRLRAPNSVAGKAETS